MENTLRLSIVSLVVLDAIMQSFLIEDYWKHAKSKLTAGTVHDRAENAKKEMTIRANTILVGCQLENLQEHDWNTIMYDDQQVQYVAK